MANTFCIVNQKGGVGKTTTAVNLSAALAALNKKTLIVDCDPQANATTGLGINKSKLEKTLYHGLIGEADIEKIITDTEIINLKILPSRVELIGFEVEKMSGKNRETHIKRILKNITDRFDYIIMDCPPSLNLLTVNAMTAADSLIIPLQSEFYALEGLTQLLETVKRIKSSFNPSLNISGILLTMIDKRTNLSHQVIEEAQKYFSDMIYKTKIPRNVSLAEAPSFGKPIMLYAPNSPGSKSYLNFAKEIIKIKKKNGR
jgi:chromosome partitioning protein